MHARVWLAVLLFAMPVHGFPAVQFPRLVAHVDMPGQTSILKVTPDHSTAVAVLRDADERMRGIVLDLRALGAPMVRSSFPVQGNVAQLEISPDGRMAVFLVSKKGADTSPTWQIVAMELSDSKAPVERWRREIPTAGIFFKGRVAIASDASAYAIARASPGRTDSQIVVQKTTGAQTSVAVTTSSYMPGLRFSQNGQFLAFGNFALETPGSVGVVNFSSSTPTVNVQKFSSYEERYRCVLAVLDNGYVILDDARTPRLGIYAPQAGVPRTATLAGNSSCSDVQAEDAKAGTLTLATASGVERIDMHDARKPRVLGHWLNPAGRSVLAISGELLFASRASGKELEIYRLDQPDSGGSFDWHGLEDSYRQIMTDYNRSHENLSGRQLQALQALQQAGAAQAIELPVSGVSPQQAAAILNDYGYLAGVTHSDSLLAEAALRRAIELDPHRRVAYLNLADLRRSGLSQSVGSENRQAAAREVADLYRKFVAEGGKSTDSIEHFLTATAPEKDALSVCQAVAGHANDGTLEDLIADQALGVDVGGRRVDLIFTTDGTAHVPGINAFDSETDVPTDVKFDPPWGEDLWGGDLLGFLMYGGAPYVIHYRDLHHPVHIVPLTTGPACEFKTTETAVVSPKAEEPKLCQALLNGTGPSNVDFNEPVTISGEEIAKRYSETSAENAARVDYDNTGVPKKVAFLSLSSGAGAGCEEQFFDVLSESGDHLSEGADHDVIAALQQLTTNRYPILPCGNTARFFVYGGKTYFESRPTEGPTDTWTQYHHVTLSDHGKVRDVCGITFKSHVDFEEKKP